MAVFSRQQRDAALETGDGTSTEDGSGRPQRRNQVGDVLREARRSYGVEIAQVGASLRIKPSYLSALEEARYRELPGPTYAVGFLRAYAEHLGLDGEEMVRRFKREVSGIDAKHDLSFPVPLAERSIPRISMVVAALILAGCGYGLWYYISLADRARPERVAAVPSTLLPERAPLSPPNGASNLPNPGSEPVQAVSPPESASTTTASRPAEPVSVVPSPQPTATPQPAPSEPPAVAAPPAAPAAQVANVPEVPPAPATSAARVYGVESGPARIVIRSSGDSWVQVRDRNQAVVLVRVLKAGDSYRVPDQPGLVLRTGNAGALQFSVDGNQVPGVGPLGKSRNVALDPSRLISGSAVIE